MENPLPMPTGKEASIIFWIGTWLFRINGRTNSFKAPLDKLNFFWRKEWERKN